MKRVERTVFISYRRRNVAWAIAVYQNLTQHGYDVFFDYKGIKSGDFETAILGNIETRAHFLVLLTPAALARCSEPGDWLRREIEHAIGKQRNIVPLMLDEFKFSKSRVKNQLTGPLAALSRYQSLGVYPDYFLEAMQRLREEFLSVELQAVTQPPPPAVKEAAREQQAAANMASLIRETQITADALFERLNKAPDLESDRQAVVWFMKAAEVGNPYGMAGLGFMYEWGRGGLPKDDMQALGWYRKAADHGATRAMTGVSVMYANGNGLGMSNFGVSDALVGGRSINMYEIGRGGLTQDEAQAVAWYREAADAGYGWGMSKLGSMYEMGRGGLPQDEEQAVAWYRKAADAGDGWGMSKLGFMYEMGFGGLVQDEAQAVAWYRKAADAGEVNGMKNLGRMYRYGRGGLPQDDAQATNWDQRASSPSPA